MGSHASSSHPPNSVVPSDGDLKSTLDSLRHIVRALRLSASDAERSLGVSGAQLFVLQTLADKPAGSIAALARRTATDPSSVSVVVRRLVERGLVAKRPSKSDARRAELALTKRGEGIARSAPPAQQTLLIEAFDRLPASTRRALGKGLAELVREMGAGDEAPALFFEGEETAERAPQRRRRALP